MKSSAARFALRGPGILAEEQRRDGFPPSTRPAARSCVRVAVAVVGLLSAALLRGAELRWLETTRTYRAEVGAESIQARFPFIVSGAGSVKVIAVQASCDCTVPALPKATWLAGERGEIVVNFTLGDRVGKQQVAIFVTTSVAPSQPVELSLEVDIPALLEVQPRFVEWKLGQTPEVRRVAVNILVPDKVKVRSVRADPAQVIARLQPEAGAWALLLRPVDASRPLETVVYLELAVAGSPTREVAVHGRVR